MAKKSNRLDIVVGQSIRIFRTAAGMSQQELGNRLGLTFQQIQKYEKGTNRIGSGRLYQIAMILNVPVSAFFEGATPAMAGVTSRRGDALESPLELIAEPHAFRLLQAFSRLEHKRLRLSVVDLVERMAEAGPQSN